MLRLFYSWLVAKHIQYEAR